MATSAEKVVTLIAGFKCRDGFVICADSQETAGPYRVSVQKLTPKRCGNFDLAITGSGTNGDIIDAFVQRLKDNVASNPDLRSLAELAKFIGREILDFRKNEAAHFSKRDRDIQFIIGARSIDPPLCEAWKTAASRLLPIRETPALVGVEDERYKYLLENLYRDNLTIAQGIFLGLHVMSVAEQTSNYVKAPISVVVLRDAVMERQPQETIDEMLQRVRLFEAQFDNFFLACPDTGLQPQEFAEKFKEFVSTIVQIRQDYFEAAVRQAVAQGLQVNEIFNLIPLGTTLAFQPTNAEQAAMQKTQEDLVKSLRENESGTQEYPRILANLAAMEKCNTEQIAYLQSSTTPPSEETRRDALKASGEILQAALMGPYKITQNAVVFLNRVRHFELMDLGFGDVVKLQLLVMAIRQATEVIRNESSAQAPSGAIPSSA